MQLPQGRVRPHAPQAGQRLALRRGAQHLGERRAERGAGGERQLLLLVEQAHRVGPGKVARRRRSERRSEHPVVGHRRAVPVLLAQQLGEQRGDVLRRRAADPEVVQQRARELHRGEALVPEVPERGAERLAGAHRQARERLLQRLRKRLGADPLSHGVDQLPALALLQRGLIAARIAQEGGEEVGEVRGGERRGARGAEVVERHGEQRAARRAARRRAHLAGDALQHAVARHASVGFRVQERLDAACGCGRQRVQLVCDPRTERLTECGAQLRELRGSVLLGTFVELPQQKSHLPVRKCKRAVLFWRACVARRSVS